MAQTYQKVRQQDDQTIVEWFKDHKVTLQTAKLPNGVEVREIVWRKPGTTNYYVVYVLYGSRLFVAGDLGEAVYGWSEILTPEFVAGCDIGYFGRKCLASSEEPKGKSWMREKAQAYLEERLERWTEENPLIDIDGPEEVEKPRTPLTWEKCKELMYQEDVVDLEEVIGNIYEWGKFLSETDGLIVSDHPDEDGKYPRAGFEPTDLYSIGYDWDIRTRSHLVGFKLAWKQLQEAEKNHAGTTVQPDPKAA